MFYLLACGHDIEVKAPDTAATEDTSPGGDAADVFYDPAVMHEVSVTIDPADWAVLTAQTRTYYDFLGEGCMEGPWESPYTWFEAQVTLDGTDLGTVGVRKKGLFGSLSATRPSLRMDMDHYVDGVRYLGLEKVVLNNQNQDTSRLRTCLAHDWFTDAGLVAPRCSLAHVTVNGEDLGVYDNTEVIDEALVERVRGAPPRTMYEGALSDFRDLYINTFEAETDESDGSDLAAVKAALEAPDDTVMEELDRVVDLDAYFTFWSAEVIAGHWDGYNGNTNNFYVWGAPEDGRLEFTASGPDAVFAPGAPFGAGQPHWVVMASALSNRLIQLPEGKARYEAELTRLLDERWDEDARLAQIDAWKELVKPVDSMEQRTSIDELRDVVAGKADDLRSELGGAVSAPVLAGNPCWTSIGTVEATFSTTWGTYPDGDVLGAGEATTAYEISGVDYVATADGVTAGDSGDGRDLLLIVSTLSPNVYLAPYIVFQPDQLVPGTDIPIDGSVAEAYLYYNSPDTGGQWTLAAYLGNGLLHLEEASDVAGATVSGTLQVDVLGSGG